MDLAAKKCGCRKWDVSGIPCKHALACITENGWDVEEYVEDAYYTSTYKKIYMHVIVPINGRHEWVKTGVQPPLPPVEPRKKGRPSNLRRRGPYEAPIKLKRKCRGGGPPALSIYNRYKLRKVQETVKCSYCNELYHNIAGCGLKKADDRLKGIVKVILFLS